MQRRDLGPHDGVPAVLPQHGQHARDGGRGHADDLAPGGINWRLYDSRRDSRCRPRDFDLNAVFNHDALVALPEAVSLVLKLALADAMHAVPDAAVRGRRGAGGDTGDPLAAAA